MKNLSVEMLEKLVQMDHNFQQAKAEALLEPKREVLSDSVIVRLAEIAMTIPGFPVFVHYNGPCGCMGKIFSSDPGCRCEMLGMLFEHRFDVALFLAKNPNFTASTRQQYNAVVVCSNQATLDKMKNFRKNFPSVTLHETKKKLNDGFVAVQTTNEYELKYTLTMYKDIGIDAEIVVL